MLIQEIFVSIQGESRLIGFPTTFVRLYGCNLSCRWCDEGFGKFFAKEFKQRDKRKMSIEDIMHEVSRCGTTNVCITGGEPLIQQDVWPLIYELVSKYYNVSIETNGSVPLQDDRESRGFFYVMDVKTPSSGQQDSTCLSNLSKLTGSDDVKFVIADWQDYVYARNVIRKYPTRAAVQLSPVVQENGDNNGDLIAKWMLKDRLPARLVLQMHKYVGWGNGKQGVK